jgi:hypothetical protein
MKAKQNIIFFQGKRIIENKLNTSNSIKRKTVYNHYDNPEM